MTREDALEVAESYVGRKVIVDGKFYRLSEIDRLCQPSTRVVLTKIGDPGKTIFRSLAEVGIFEADDLEKAIG